MGYDGADANDVVDRFVTLDVLKAVHGPGMHPEFYKRFFAMIEAAEGLVGPGGGLRANPSNTSAASMKGNSFHQKQLFKSGLFVYQAIDTVGHAASGPKSHQVAWYWIKDNCHRFGLMSAWNWTEPEFWHVQCWDLPRAVTSWRAQGSPDPFIFQIPNEPSTPVGVFVHATVRLGDINADVYALQSVLRNKCAQVLTVSGKFDNATDVATKNFQKFFGLEEDGIAGPKTWELVDFVVNN